MMLCEKKRVFDPCILSNPVLKTDKHLRVYLALHFLAEDSGCTVLDVATLRIKAFPLTYDKVKDSVIEQIIEDLKAFSLLWEYEVPGSDKNRYAYLPEAPGFNKSLRNRYKATIPLPPGIRERPVDTESRNNPNRVTYDYPNSRDELIGNYPQYNDGWSDDDIDF